MTAFEDSTLLNPREAVFMSLLKTRLHSFWHLFMNALVYSANVFLFYCVYFHFYKNNQQVYFHHVADTVLSNLHILVI